MSSNTKSQTLKMDPLFKRKGIAVVIMVFVGFIIVSSMTNDGMNILTTSLPELRGWSQTMITVPSTVGGWLSLIVTIAAGTLIKRIGCFNCYKIGIGVMTIATFIVGTTTAYNIYFVAFVLIKCSQALTFFSSVKLCTDWFFEYRGRVLGIVTIGPPVSSAILIPILQSLTVNTSFSTAWIFLGCLGAAMFIFVCLLGKSAPEDYGWQQDGFNRSPEQLAQLGMTDDTPNIWTLKRMIRKKEYWILTAAGALGGMTFGCGLMLFAPVSMSAGMDSTRAFATLAVGSALAIPLSFISGVIDDKFGTKKAFLIVLAFTILMPLSFVAMLVTKITAFSYIAAFCVGTLAGCLLNLNPSAKTWAFGRKAFTDFNRTAQAVENALVPLGATFLSIFFDITGAYTVGYVILTIIMLVIFVPTLFMKSYAPEVIGFETAKQSAEAIE